MFVYDSGYANFSTFKEMLYVSWSVFINFYIFCNIYFPKIRLSHLNFISSQNRMDTVKLWCKNIYKF